MKDRFDLDLVVQTVLDAYLAGQNELTARQLGELLGVAAPTASNYAYRVFDAEGWKRIELTHTYVAIQRWGYDDKTRKTTAWTVNKRYLADLFLAARRSTQ